MAEAVTGHYDRVSKGLPPTFTGKLDTTTVLRACQDAVGQFPDNPRHAFLYGQALNGAGKTDEALEWVRKAATQGSLFAQLELAGRYLAGKGVPKDEAQARRWMQAAAEGGSPVAQNNLGLMLVKDDLAESIAWFHKAAEQGLPIAQLSLFDIYMNGGGDPAEGVRWLRTYAMNERLSGDPLLVSAYVILGALYREGQGVTRDPVEAVKWFRLAAERGDAEACNALVHAYFTGEGVTLNPILGVVWFIRGFWYRAREDRTPKELLRDFIFKRLPGGEHILQTAK